MQFATYCFILVILPLTILGYFLLGHFGKLPPQVFLVLLSVSLYACGGIKGLLVFLVSILVNALLCWEITHSPARKKLLLWTGIALHVGLLVVFKYLGFFAGIAAALCRISISVPGLVLPLGISFFTFQQISYLADTASGKTEGNSLLDYLLYITYYPKLLMGPIVRQDKLLGQFRQEETYRINSENLVKGLQQFVFGLAKKVILADTFAGASAFLSMENATSMELILASLAFTFQIYFDFSGYTDMATGFSQMLNITLPQNFDSPYWALSIRDFWKRWHMSLTRFLTDYIYIPLGGNRKGKIRMMLNTMLVFLISGLWHGANWTFLLWGILNGALSLFDRATEKSRQHIHPAMQWMLTFAAVNVLWMLFNSQNIHHFIHFLGKMLTFGDTSIGDTFLQYFETPELVALLELPGFLQLRNMIRGLPMLLTYGLAFTICMSCENTTRRKYRMGTCNAILMALLLVLCLTCLSQAAVFVYNDF